MTHELTDKELIAANRQGLIAGPNETDEQFKKRLCRCQGSKDAALVQSSWFQKALDGVEHLYHIRPDWVEVCFSNRGLCPWHGGGTVLWEDEDHHKHLYIQLRKVFAKSERSFWGYTRTELLAHELVHAGRMAFEEERFEEMLAYRVSRWSLRRYLGPLIKKKWEAMLLIGVLLLIVGVDAASFAMGSFFWMQMAQALRIVPFFLIALAAWRQAKDHKTMEGTRKKLIAFGVDQDRVEAVLYRLTDHEIGSVIPLLKSRADWQEFVLQQAKRSLRWRQILLSYLGPTSS